METFKALGVDPFFTGRLAERNIRTPTEIQKQVIPFLAAGEPVIFRSATGTGKTFAYLLPLLQQLLAGEHAGGREPGGGFGEHAGKSGGLRMLICAPTYELCSQIKSEADFLLTGAAESAAGAAAELRRLPVPLKISLLIGSAAMNRQIETLRKEKPAVVVGNPGRVLALARLGKLKLGGLKILVLDEGDRLTADELRGETEELVKLLGPARSRDGCLMTACSATLSPKSRERLLGLFGGLSSAASPRIIETEEQEILRDRIEHWAIFSEGRRKIQSLRSLLAAVQPKKALIFSGRGGQPGIIVSRLQYHHISAAGLYGDMDKKKRKEAIDGFRSGKIAALVSSDLAARGLDIPGITHVIALDVPADEGPYIHRAGRTGRAGKRGIMITIGDAEEMRRLVRLEKKLGIVIHPRELYGGKIYNIREE
ncbi:MAG: DEAD/DEAH box helicase [Treponema sp.]|jgi:superfamily II DNA/RNA helicase|nr:DEAD/DEAH box helicase [Treponema sp.]